MSENYKIYLIDKIINSLSSLILFLTPLVLIVGFGQSYFWLIIWGYILYKEF